MSFYLLRALALVILPLGSAVAAETDKVTFLVSSGADYDSKLSSRVVQRLVELGAPIAPIGVSPGQVTHAVDGKTPACALTILRDVPGRERFHWIAPSAVDEIVIATPRGSAPDLPAAGDYVAAFSVKAMLDAAEALGLKVIPGYSFDQVSSILRNGRTRFFLGLRAQIEQVNEKGHLDLIAVKTVKEMVAWAGCNAEVPEADAAAVDAAWRKAAADGSLQRIYAESGMEKMLPSP